MINNKEIYNFLSSRNTKSVLVGDSALAVNGLVYGTPIYCICTSIKTMNEVSLLYSKYEYYHYHDDYQLSEIAPNVFLPSPERAIIDTIVWLPENVNEGALIEALQTYQEKNDKSKLYECANHYNVPYEFIDYWWQEALNESDMSMG